MSTYADDIKRIAKQDEPKGALGLGLQREQITGSAVPIPGLEEDDTSPILSPLSFEALTYDHDQDEVVVANNGTFIYRTVLTAQITDANGKVWLINNDTTAT